VQKANTQPSGKNMSARRFHITLLNLLHLEIGFQASTLKTIQGSEFSLQQSAVQMSVSNKKKIQKLTNKSKLLCSA
jgi:hypothetical protein